MRELGRKKRGKKEGMEEGREGEICTSGPSRACALFGVAMGGCCCCQVPTLYTPPPVLVDSWFIPGPFLSPGGLLVHS